MTSARVRQAFVAFLFVGTGCSRSYPAVCDLLFSDNFSQDNNDDKASDLDSAAAVLRGAAKTIAEQCGPNSILDASRSLASVTSQPWRAAVSEVAKSLAEAAPAFHASSSSQEALSSDAASVQQELSYRAGPFEKGDYLRRAVEAWNILEAVKGGVGAHSGLDSNSDNVDWDRRDGDGGGVWPSVAAARKNLAYWAEQRGLEGEAREVLEEGMRRILLAPHRSYSPHPHPSHLQPSTDGSSGSSSRSKNGDSSSSSVIDNRSGSIDNLKWGQHTSYAGYALFNASLCPPHFSSNREARMRCHEILQGLDDFLAQGLVRLKYLRSSRRHLDTSSPQSSSCPSSSVNLLRFVGNLPIAWPYLGKECPIKPLHERLSAAYRLVSLISSLPCVGGMLDKVDKSKQQQQQQQQHKSIVSGNSHPLTAVAPHLSQPHHKEGRRRVGVPQPSAEAAAADKKRRRVRVGVVGEGLGNTSPGVLAEGFLVELDRSRFEVVWFELSSLAGYHPTPFSAKMRQRADATVTLHESEDTFPPLLTPDDPTSSSTGAAAGAGASATTRLRPRQRVDALAEARVAVGKCEVDVLLYLAIGLTPLTALLSQARLAPVQMVFGHGHPLTTGHRDSVDYFISSGMFEPPEPLPPLPLPPRYTHIEKEAAKEEQQGWPWEQVMRKQREQHTHQSPSLQRPSLSSVSSSTYGPSSSSSSSEHYTEQLVLFDSLTTTLTVASVGGCANNYNGDDGSGTDDVSCAYGGGTRLSRRALLEQLGFSDLLSRRPGPSGGWGEADEGGDDEKVKEHQAANRQHDDDDDDDSSDNFDDDFGDDDFDDDLDDPGASHVHLLLQHSKKVHPAMDRALKLILQSDPRAVVVLLDGSRAHLPRWRRTIAGVTEGDDNGEQEGGSSNSSTSNNNNNNKNKKKLNILTRLRFLPRVSHPSILALLRVADSFLDPWPWGSGVTSAEAFAACLPVVTFPGGTSVLQLSLGQLRKMGLEGRVFEKDTAAETETRTSTTTSESRFPPPTSSSSSSPPTMSLVASDDVHFAALVTRLGTDPAFRATSRKRLCERRSLLFGRQGASEEWAGFLERAALPFMGP